jgi:hypothetical protein
LHQEAPGALAGSAAGAVAAEATDPFLSRNEFKEGFYVNQESRSILQTLWYSKLKQV